MKLSKARFDCIVTHGERQQVYAGISLSTFIRILKEAYNGNSEAPSHIEAVQLGTGNVQLQLREKGGAKK